jgi:hypothetical protein
MIDPKQFFEGQFVLFTSPSYYTRKVIDGWPRHQDYFRDGLAGPIVKSERDDVIVRIKNTYYRVAKYKCTLLDEQTYIMMILTGKGQQ